MERTGDDLPDFVLLGLLGQKGPTDFVLLGLPGQKAPHSSVSELLRSRLTEISYYFVKTIDVVN
jgi:hypothetical protein